MSDAPVTDRPRPGRFRFTLRLLLVVMTVLCVWLAIHTHRARQQQRIVQHIQATYGSVVYDCDHGPAFKTGEGSPVPRWLLTMLGKDFFHSVTSAHVRGEVELSEVARMSALKHLVIWKEDLADSDIEKLTRLADLRNLMVQSDRHRPLPGSFHPATRIGDRSLAILARMPRLELIYLEGDHFTSWGIAELGVSRSLRAVDLRNCDASVTEADIEPLRQAGRINTLSVRRWKDGGPDDVVASW